MRFGAITAGLSRGATRRRLSLLLALVLVLQGLLVQAHVHLPRQADNFASTPTISAPGDASFDAQHRACHLCQEYLSGGSYLSAPSFVLPALLFRWVMPWAPQALHHGPARHTWQSRGPPYA